MFSMVRPILTSGGVAQLAQDRESGRIGGGREGMTSSIIKATKPADGATLPRSVTLLGTPADTTIAFGDDYEGH
jgi:hypothetical protein